jgi:hypothetical protein
MEDLKCIYCKKVFSTAGNLKSHQAKTKKCLALQNKKPEPEYKCDYCDKEFLRQHHYQNHLTKHIINKDVERVENAKDRIKTLEIENKIFSDTINELREEIQKLQRETRGKIERLQRELREALDRERETLTKLAMKDSTTNYNISNNYVIKADDLRPISEMELKKHDFDKRYLTQYIIGDGIAKFLLDIMLKDNSFWSDRERKLLSWRFKNVLIKDKNAKKLWEVYMNAHGEKLIDIIGDEERKYRTSTTLDVDTKNEFIVYCIQASSDIYKFMEIGEETETERTFCRYLYNNLGSKQELIEIINSRETESD